MAFPATSVLSSFTGSDEDPLSEGGDWGGQIQSGTIGNLRRASNQAAPSTSQGTSQSYWATQMGADQEAYATVSTKPADGDYVAVWLRVQSPGSGSAVGYQCVMIADSGTDKFQVWRMSSGGSYTQVTDGTLNATQEFSSGDSFGASIDGTTITLWYKPSAGSWTQIGQGNDSNISGAGYIGLDMNHAGSSTRADDFGGGTLPGVAYDAQSESHTGTTGSTSQASFSWTHTPAGTPRCAVVFVFTFAAAPLDTGVTYGGAAMTQLLSGFDTDTEPGGCRAYFLDNVASGAQTVVVSRTNNASTVYAVCFTMTASGACTVDTSKIVTKGGSSSNTGSSTSATGTQAAGVIAVDDGSPGGDSLRLAGQYYGGSAPLAAGTGSTAGPSIDRGSYVAATYRETTPGQGSRNVGSASGTDDLGVVALAVSLSTGTTYTQTLSATQAQTAAAARGGSRTLSASSQPQTAAAARAPMLFRAAAAAQAAAATRRPAKNVAATQGQTAALRRLAQRLLAAAQAQSGSAAAVKTGRVTIAATQPQTASLSRAGRKQVAAGQPQTATIRRAAGRLLAATQAAAATCVRGGGRTLAAPQTQGATVAASKLLGEVLTAAQTAAATVKRTAARHTAATQPQTATVARHPSRILAAAQTAAAAIKRTGAHLLAATQTQTPSTTHRPAHTAAATQPTVATTTRAAAIHAAAATAATGIIVRQPRRTIAATQPQTAASDQATGNMVTLSAGQTATASVSNHPGKTLYTAAGTSATVATEGGIPSTGVPPVTVGAGPRIIRLDPAAPDDAIEIALAFLL